jgi:hypothetical protein
VANLLSFFVCKYSSQNKQIKSWWRNQFSPFYNTPGKNISKARFLFVFVNSCMIQQQQQQEKRLTALTN